MSRNYFKLRTQASSAPYFKKKGVDWRSDTPSVDVTKSLTITTSNRSLRLERKAKKYWSYSYWLMGEW